MKKIFWLSSIAVVVALSILSGCSKSNSSESTPVITYYDTVRLNGKAMKNTDTATINDKLTIPFYISGVSNSLTSVKFTVDTTICSFSLTSIKKNSLSDTGVVTPDAYWNINLSGRNAYCLYATAQYIPKVSGKKGYIKITANSTSKYSPLIDSLPIVVK